MADLRALTLTPEWAWAVCRLDKRVENRTWPAPATIIGQRIAIHAGKAAPDWSAVYLMAGCARWQVDRYARMFRKPGVHRLHPLGKELTRGAIVATAIVSGCRAVDQRDAVGWEAGPWCWDLTDVRVLERPESCRGALGLWRVPSGYAEEGLHG